MKFPTMTVTMKMVGLVVMCCHALGCAEDSTSATQVMLPRIKRKQNICPLNQKCKQKIQKFISTAVKNALKSSNDSTMLEEQTAMMTQLQEARAGLVTLQTQLQDAQAKLQDANNALQQAKADLNAATPQVVQTETGSTYVRWGRTRCPDNSERVYSGLAGGSLFTRIGSAANALCLTKRPQYDKKFQKAFGALLSVAQYTYIPGRHEHDAPCAVCRVPQSTTIMMAATLTCPSGWTPQYTGHLVAGHSEHEAASEYLCLDGQPENVPNSRRHRVGYALYYTTAICGGLPCGPYASERAITCVVCSK